MKSLAENNIEQERASGELDDLLAVEDGLTDSEVKWIEIFARVRDERPFSKREIEVIDNIYTRRKLLKLIWESV